jgi:hypothetical protein
MNGLSPLARQGDVESDLNWLVTVTPSMVLAPHIDSDHEKIEGLLVPDDPLDSFEDEEADESTFCSQGLQNIMM